MASLESFPAGGVALVVGAQGGLGAALMRGLEDAGAFSHVVGWARGGEESVDITQEAEIARAAKAVLGLGPLRLVIVASGVLTIDGTPPERSLRDLDPETLLAAFRVNTIGPALVAKHLLPHWPRAGKAVFAALSARVGSIGDNRLGGWYGYRASKAALNQIVRTAAVELARRAPEAICLALHPGTVDTRLSRPFAHTGLVVQTPEAAAAELIAVIDALGPRQSGGFLDRHGLPIPW